MRRSATRVEWNRVLDGFRVVYHDKPGDVHAPDAVNAVAELLAQEGSQAGDQKLLRAAVGQYEFLRTQYPGSRLRVAALLAEGRIEDALGDAAAARKAYIGVVREAPGSEVAGVARGLLVASGPTHRDGAAMNGARVPVGGSAGETADSSASLRNDNTIARRNEHKNAMRNQNKAALLTENKMPEATVAGAESLPVEEPHVSDARRGAPAVVVIPIADSSASLRNDNKESRNDAKVVSGNKSLAEVTGIRHWSTPTYTRVAIDLGDEVKFEAARVPHPDRIYFDLHGAKLAAELVGKSFDVTDDGFLRKIRAAQATGDVTRVVLDVSDVTEYSAFLLPNPYRLIIDIHGKRTREEGSGKRDEETGVPVTAGAGRVASAAANTSGLPAMATTDGGAPVEAGGGRSFAAANDTPPFRR